MHQTRCRVMCRVSVNCSNGVLAGAIMCDKPNFFSAVDNSLSVHTIESWTSAQCQAKPHTTHKYHIHVQACKYMHIIYMYCTMYIPQCWLLGKLWGQCWKRSMDGQWVSTGTWRVLSVSPPEMSHSCGQSSVQSACLVEALKRSREKEQLQY